MSNIEWTDTTWNPVTGCSRVSPGCDNCYMFALWPRLHAMGVKGYEGEPDAVALHKDRLKQPYFWKKPRRVFVNSMSDLFHIDIPYEFLEKAFNVMMATPEHSYQVLTKRPGRAVAFWSKRLQETQRDWPDNVWIGTSVESQKYAPRIEVLSRIPAAVRFVSAEPLIEPLTLADYMREGHIKWLIVGGESGHRARPMDPQWARTLRDEALQYDVPFFLKQLGGRRSKRGGDEALLDDRTWAQYPEEVSVG